MYAVLIGLQAEEFQENERKKELILFRKILRDSCDPFQFPNNFFIAEFRLNKYLVQYLIDELKNVLIARRSCAIPVETKVFAVLSYYASGVYQRNIGSSFYSALSQSCMSNIVHEITNAIYENVVDRWILFPNTDIEKEELQRYIYRHTGVPNIIGCVDGTLINILAPSQEEHNYVDRKGNHSKNVQVVCDYNLRVLSINARFVGSAHDAFIWRNSQVHEHMRNSYTQGSPYLLLGDSGYPSQPWLLTPIRHAERNTPEYRYTNWHSRTRSCVERCIGRISQRFRCLSCDNKMRYNPTFVGKIVTVSACFHNMCIHNDVVIDNEDDEDIEDFANNVHDDDEEFVHMDDLEEGFFYWTASVLSFL